MMNSYYNEKMMQFHEARMKRTLRCSLRIQSFGPVNSESAAMPCKKPTLWQRWFESRSAIHHS